MRRIIWIEEFAEKLADKHSVSTDEVEECLSNSPFVRRLERGRIRGEDLYAAYGQTDSGRYLIIFFIRKSQGESLPLSARDMSDKERYFYDEHR